MPKGRPIVDYPAIEPINTAMIGFAAGMYELNGNCNTEYDKLIVTIYCSNALPLYKLTDYFGGKFYKANSKTFKWQIRHSRAYGFMFTIYKFISPSKREEFTNMMKNEARYKEINRLAHYNDGIE